MPGQNGLKRHLLFTITAGAVVAADQALKWAIFHTVGLYQRIEIVPGFFNVVHFRNPGGAFGLFAAHNGWILSLFFLAVTIAALGLILYFYCRTPARQELLRFGLALVFGGAVGNLIDRLRFGSVIDYIDLYVGKYHWPAFNLADSAITVGIIIFAGYVMFRKMPA